MFSIFMFIFFWGIPSYYCYTLPYHTEDSPVPGANPRSGPAIGVVDRVILLLYSISLYVFALLLSYLCNQVAQISDLF